MNILTGRTTKLSRLYQNLDSYVSTNLPVRTILSDEDALVKEKCEVSFHEFVKNAWLHVDGRDYIDGWHVQAMCEHLQAIQKLEIKKLLCNMPPRTGKSMIFCVLFPAWCWTIDPGLRFLYTSYSKDLTIRDSVFCRRLIASDWYQKIWGDKFSITRDVDNKCRYDNNKHGYRLATSVGSTITGHGGDINCFPYETSISTDMGDIPIGKIVEDKIECKIISYNHDSHEIELKEITNYNVNPSQELIEIELEDGTIIRCTEDHPLYIEGKGYILAKDVTCEDVVLCLS